MTHKVDCSEASMTDLPQVCEELLGVLPEEQLSHLRVLQAPGPHTRRHGQRLHSVDHTSSVTFLFRLTTFVLTLSLKAQHVWDGKKTDRQAFLYEPQNTI